MIRLPAPPVTDYLTVALRAFAGPTYRELKDAPDSSGPKRSRLPASDWTLIFDTETNPDAGQALRFGTYQVRCAGEPHEFGIFYAPDNVTADELAALQSYAGDHDLTLTTREDFVDRVFFGIAYQFRATIVGFNLPFDISRLAVASAPARGRMRGGFSFTLSAQKIYPHVQIKHLSQSASIIQFAAPMKQRTGRAMRGRGDSAPVRRGHFVDTKTLAKGLAARSFTLASLSAFLGVEHPKLAFDDFYGAIDREMIEYAVGDTVTTWECYEKLIEKFDALGLGATRPEQIFSEASVGKAYLKAMAVKPWQRLDQLFPRQMLGNIMGSYFGGRSEVRIRREKRRVMLCDFLSMYPTVCTLMGLWPFIIADGMTWRDATEATRERLASIGLGALRSKECWADLATMVRVPPDADIFPVRAPYGEADRPANQSPPPATIGANYLSGDTALWFTLADCIASKLLTGKAPEIVEAVTFSPGPMQAGLCPVNICGKPDYHVDPVATDFFKRVIELRHETKQRLKSADLSEQDALDAEQYFLKIVANSTSYGVYAEVNVADLSAPMSATVHSSTSDRFTFPTKKDEQPGTFFHPLLATLICGAARLMLAITERLADDHCLDWAFCDTDSMAIAMPERMDADEFTTGVAQIVDWFAALNPYKFGGSILKIEDVNYRLGSGEPEPLYCWAVSAKRYALFNVGADGLPIMRKISAHGLGHLLTPYGDADPAPGVPVPHPSVLTDGVERWHHDLWWQIVRSGLSGKPDMVDLSYHPALLQPAMSRYAATTPALLGWFNAYNRDVAEGERVQPFNFLLAMMATRFQTKETIVPGTPKSTRRTAKPYKPVAAYDRDFERAAGTAFDRETGKRVDRAALKSYRDALADYHLHPEGKFLNADYHDRGTTQRRHVRMIGTRHIGKEAQDWERQAYAGFEPDAVPDYGVTGYDRAELMQATNELITQIGIAKAAKALAATPRRLRRYLDGTASFTDVSFAQCVASRLPHAMLIAHRIAQNRQTELQQWREAVARDGLRNAARQFGKDASNLRRTLAAFDRSAPCDG